MTKSFEYQLIATPDGASSILEVSFEGEDFLHVSKTNEGDLELTFFSSEKFVLTESELDEITANAHKQLSVVDFSAFDT